MNNWIKEYLTTYLWVAALLFVAMGLLLFDFVTKAYVYYVLAIPHPFLQLPFVDMPVFQQVFGVDFSITLAMNKGAAWGLLAEMQLPLLLVRGVAIVGLLAYLLFFNPSRSSFFPLILIISGALGNVVDFFLYRSVVDFLHFNLWGYHFPIFNFADSYITIGVAWLLCLALFKTQSQRPVSPQLER